MYIITINGLEVVYDLEKSLSDFSPTVEGLLRHEIVKTNNPTEYGFVKDNDYLIHYMSNYYDLKDRFETLLHQLPQDDFSSIEAHPAWVADSVRYNTLDKEQTTLDVIDMIETHYDDSVDLINALSSYFRINSSQL